MPLTCQNTLSDQAQPSAVSQAIFWIVITSITTTTVNAIAKILAPDLHAFQLVFYYSLIGLVGFIPLALQGKINFPPPGTRLLYVTRAVLEFMGFSLVFYTVAILPLPLVTSLQFLAPLLGSITAVILLGEKATRHTWLALLGGLGGVLIITRPDVSAIDLNALLVILAALCFALCSNCIKVLSRSQSSTNIAFYMLSLTGIIAFFFALPVWKTPPSEIWVWLGMMGALVFICQWSVAQAMSKADLIIILPFFFLNMLWSSVYGYMFFNEIVTVPTIIGSVVILASTMYALLMVRRRRVVLSLEP